MDVCLKCHQNVSAALLNNGVCVFCETEKHDMVKKLMERIAELELELQKQKRVAEKGETLLKVMWGDDFNDDSLH